LTGSSTDRSTPPTVTDPTFPPSTISAAGRLVVPESYQWAGRSCHNYSYRPARTPLTSTNTAAGRYHPDARPKHPNMRGRFAWLCSHRELRRAPLPAASAAAARVAGLAAQSSRTCHPAPNSVSDGVVGVVTRAPLRYAPDCVFDTGSPRGLRWRWGVAVLVRGKGRDCRSECGRDADLVEGAARIAGADNDRPWQGAAHSDGVDVAVGAVWLKAGMLERCAVRGEFDVDGGGCGDRGFWLHGGCPDKK
jgi:hypothetical protein